MIIEEVLPESVWRSIAKEQAQTFIRKHRKLMDALAKH
jgi:hypothetical protein